MKEKLFKALSAMITGIFMFSTTGLAAQPASPNLVFACAADNDLYQAISAGNATFPRHETAAFAVQSAPNDAGVLILADGGRRQ